MSSSNNARPTPLKVAWISDYPVEWMPDLPDALRGLRRQHPATWAMVLLEEFQRREDVSVEVIVLRSKVRNDVSFERNGTTYHLLKASGLVRVSTLFWLDTLLIRRKLGEIHPHLIHAWGTERGAALIASRLQIPFLVTMQGILQWYARTSPDTNRFQRFAARLEPIALRRARVATTESKFAVAYLKEHYPKLHVHQAEHAPNRVFHEAQRRPQLKPFRIVTVGTMGHRKGTDLLLKALGRMTAELNFKLTVISGPVEGYLESLRNELPSALWDRLEIKTHLSPAQVAAELEQAALLVLPTRSDTSPNAVKEAAVAGVPVVATTVGGIPDYITHGKNGLLCTPGDLDALTQTLREANRHPLFSQGRVEQETWHKVRDYLSPEQMGRNFFQAYQLALKAWNQPQQA